ncbi:MAG: GTP cyclohydrolase I [Myxococcales bacterium]|nr:GTP cyclohydrolase I [Myxococcales bacterium]
MPVDRQRAQLAIEDFLRALGRDPDSDPELRGTPERVTDAFADELLRGYAIDTQRLVSEALSPARGDEDLVLVKHIRVATMCPHHLMPALGEALVAYLPGEHVLGIGTLARLVHAFAERLTLQETIGEKVVEALMSDAGARGACCRLRMRHSCLSARGSREHTAEVESWARSGELQGAAGIALLGAVLGGR